LFLTIRASVSGAVCRCSGNIQVTPELRTETIAALARHDLSFERRWSSWFKNQACTLDLSRDLEHYLSAEPEGGFALRQTSRGNLIRRFDSGSGVKVWHLDFAGREGSALVGYADGSAEVWALAEARPWWRAGGWGPLERVILALHPNGDVLAYATQDGSVWIVDRLTGTEYPFCSAPKPVTALGFDPAGERLLVVRTEHAEAFEFAAARRIWSLSGPFYHARPGWTEDGGRVALSTTRGYLILVCDATNGQVLQSLSGHQLEPRHMAFHPDGRRLTSVGWDGALILWDSMTGAELLRARAWPRTLRFSSDGGRLALCPDLKDVAVMRLASVDVFREFNGGPPSGKHIHPPDISPDGQWVATVSNTELRLWDVARARVVWAEPAHDPDWASVLFTPEGDALIQSERSRGIFRRALVLTDAAPGGLVALGAAEPVAPGRPGNLVGIDPASGDWWVERLDLGKLVRWAAGRADDETPAADLSRWDGPIISPDDRWAVTGGHSETGVRIWDLTTAQLETRLPVDRPACFQFSPDGRWLVTGTDREYRLWEMGTWRAATAWPARLEAETTGGVYFSPDGEWVAIGQGRGEIELRETRDYSMLIALEPPVALRTGIARWAPDGSRLFMLSVGHRLVSWEITTIRRELAARGLDW
jgi:WD40 repeat protein